MYAQKEVLRSIGFRFAVLAILLAPVHAFSEPSGDVATTIRVALNADILSTNPGVRRDSNTDIIHNHIFESLVAYRQDISVGPLVAQDFTISEDRKSYSFRIREGLVFHNGEAVTAADVKWSWDRYLDPATNWKCRRWFVASDEEGGGNQGVVIKAVRVVGEDEVVFELESENALFLDLLANFQCLPGIVHKDSVDSSGKWVRPIGTGPYKLKRWQRGEYIELEKFDAYMPRNEPRDGLTGARIAQIDNIRFQILPDAAATRAALLSGSIDVFPFVPMHMVEDLKSQPEVRILHSETLGWSEMLIQTVDPVLSDPAIRKAIAHAIDREQIVGFTTFGRASVNSSGVPVSHPAHTSAHDAWHEHSIDKARELLSQSGYRGEVIMIQTNRKYPGMYNNALVIQAMLQAVGINAQLELLDWASQLANYYSGKFQLMTFSFSAIANPTLRYSKLIGSKAERSNVQWDSAEAAKVLQRAWLSGSQLESQQIYEELHRLMLDDVPLIGLYNARFSSANSKNIVGFEPWPLELPRLWGVSIKPE